jgi:hypothetical protein
VENVDSVILEIDGEKEEYSRALHYSNEIGVMVERAERNVF